MADRAGYVERSLAGHATEGQWPRNSVAKSWTGGRRTGYQTFYQIRSI
jgi:hypothetical protein